MLQKSKKIQKKKEKPVYNCCLRDNTHKYQIHVLSQFQLWLEVTTYMDPLV
jgi:hypothetical protein